MTRSFSRGHGKQRTQQPCCSSLTEKHTELVNALEGKSDSFQRIGSFEQLNDSVNFSLGITARLDWVLLFYCNLFIYCNRTGQFVVAVIYFINNKGNFHSFKSSVHLNNNFRFYSVLSSLLDVDYITARKSGFHQFC